MGKVKLTRAVDGSGDWLSFQLVVGVDAAPQRQQDDAEAVALLRVGLVTHPLLQLGQVRRIARDGFHPSSIAGRRRKREFGARESTAIRMNWEKSTVRVTSPKTEHIGGKGEHIIPLALAGGI